MLFCYSSSIVFFNETAPTEIYTYLHTLSLHDALPIFGALFGSVGDVFLHLGHGVAVDQRTLYHAVGKAVAHLHGFDFGGQALDQVFIDTRLDVDAVGAHAGLAGVAILRGQDDIDGTIEIGVVEHNERSIDAKLQQLLLDDWSTLFPQLSPPLGPLGRASLW